MTETSPGYNIPSATQIHDTLGGACLDEIHQGIKAIIENGGNGNVFIEIKRGRTYKIGFSITKIFNLPPNKD